MPSTQECFKEEHQGMSVINEQGAAAAPQTQPKPPRTFAPVLIETITKTNRRPRPHPIDTTAVPIRQAAPKPEETPTDTPAGDLSATTKRRRSSNKFADEWEEWGSKAEQEFGKRKNRDKTKEKERKAAFRQTSPVARRFRRGSDDKASPLSIDGTSTADGRTYSPLFLEIERATSPITRRRPSWASLRSSHSFKVPELDPIESSESEPESPFSQPLSSSNSNQSQTCSSASVTQEVPSEAESNDERCSDDCIFKLADEKFREEKLREQAMSAYANNDDHERIDHFAFREETINVITPAETPLEERNARRESFFPESNWGVLDMRKHRETLEKQREEKQLKKKRLEERLNRGNKEADPWEWDGAPSFNPFSAMNLLSGPMDDEELAPLRKGAHPPLLGQDLEFPRCQSPEPASFDTTQGCDAVKMAQTYLTEQSAAAERGEGLWCGSNLPTSRPSLYSLPPSNIPSRSPSPAMRMSGLWSGSCTALSRSPPSGPVGLFTPHLGTASPASPAPTPLQQTNVLPPTPPASNPDLSSIDQKLAAEAAIEEEFSDSFVTQVYNYLSLGYPAIGRQFDAELSRISKIPIAELRQDDSLKSARGYVRLGEDREPDAEVCEEGCMRWRALRSYVREWARQNQGICGNKASAKEKERNGDVGRRGSWAQ